MKRRYEFRRNMLAGEVEFRARGSYYIHFAPVTETVLNSIGLNAQAEGLALWDRDVKRYVYSDRVPVFYPLEDYLEYLPEWDGKDHIRALADTLPTANAQWRNLFYIWFLSMTAHWYQARAFACEQLVAFAGRSAGMWQVHLVSEFVAAFASYVLYG